MRKILFALIFTAALAGGLHAQPAQPAKPRKSVGLNLLDADKDGDLSADEIANAAVVLRSLDKNHDGKLTEDELRPPPKEDPNALKPDELVANLMLFDQNGNGKLEKSEVPERMQGIFERGDVNKDGVLTVDEIRAMAKAEVLAAAPQPKPAPGGGIMHTDTILNALDQDHDGLLSAEEIAGASQALQALDKNHDGKVTQDEIFLPPVPRADAPAK